MTTFPGERQGLSTLWLHSKAVLKPLFPLRLFRWFHWIQEKKIKKSGSLTSEKHSLVRAQGDLMFGGKRRSILLNWGNGWGPGFGIRMRGEASSSKRLQPDPHHLLPHFCFRETFLGKNTTELRLLQNGICLNHFFCWGLKIEIQKPGAAVGWDFKAAFSRLHFLLD